ncbi:MAG: SagB/ThcOx family dehydrogenase [Bacteroidales bacterium]|nr:SagB/ThcOx family dehydrogenase [Bacteroidales bacterium]
MKKLVLLSTLSIMFIFVACQQKAQPVEEKQKDYVPQNTTPMEINSFETIQLQTPDYESGDALLAVAKKRKSDREFENRNLSLKHLSEILWMANGINRGDDKRTVPSAMALYPIQTYAVLANGIYLYDPAAHSLVPVKEGDHRELAGLQPFVQTAPLNLVFIADYSRYDGDRKIPENKRLYLAALDAGHSTQNVYMYCASEGLKAVVRAGAQEEALLDLLGLDKNQYQFVVAQTVGY